MDKPWKVVVAFAGVFLAGALAGGAIMQRYDHPPRGGRLPPPPEFVPRILQRMTDRLELTPDQVGKIRPILVRTQSDFQQLRRGHVKDVTQLMERMHSDVAAVLTPDQRTKLDQMRQDFRARADRVRREFRGEGSPPRPGEKDEPSAPQP